MFKKTCTIATLCVLVQVLFFSCSRNTRIVNEVNTAKSRTYYTFFDTVTTVSAYSCESDEEFENVCSELEKIFDYYHRLFDIYHEYSGINNLCTVNKLSGQNVSIDKELADFLLYAKQCYDISGGEVNVMMGSVLKLWHNALENSEVPAESALKEAAIHTDIGNLYIDSEKSIVKIEDEKASLDVGALAKGYAVEKAATYLKDKGLTGYIINAGGNVRLIGTKTDGSKFKVAIRNPNEEDSFAAVLNLSDTSCVTSGIYERNFTSDGVTYHHIIDPDTLYPSRYFRSVSVITEDSGIADMLSTALSCMSYEEGLDLIGTFEDCGAMWITFDNEYLYSDNFPVFNAEEGL